MSNTVGFIIKLNDKFSRVARNVKKSTQSLNSGFKKLAENIEILRTKLRGASKNLIAFGAKMSAAITIPFLFLSKSMIDAGSDAAETASKFDQVFDTIKTKANQIAKEFAKSFGLASSTSKKLLGDTGDLLVGFGFTGDQALELSKKVNMLAADLASFQNLKGGTAQASKALTSALLGETESAKSLGIVIRQNDPAFKKQIKQLQKTKGLTEMQAKAITILNVATSQSKKSIGDISRTWNDYANVSRRASEKTKQLKEAFGKILLPVAIKIMNAIGKLIDTINKFPTPVKKIILVLGGVAAVVGPLIISLGALGFALSFISIPVLLIVAAIAALTAGLYYLIKNWDYVVKVFEEKINKLKNLFNSLWQDLKTNFNNAIDAILEKWTLFKNTIKSTLKSISNVITDAFSSFDISKKLSGIGDFFKSGTDPVASVSSPVVSSHSRADVNVNLNAPKKTINSIETKTSGDNLNLGVNMAYGL